MYEIRDIEFGSSLSGSLFLPDNMAKPVPVVILCHGLGSNKEAMEENAHSIQEKGIASFIFDFRGHGHSDGELNEKIYEDIDEAFTFVSSLSCIDKRRICIVGHSLGAFSSVVASERLISRVFALVILACPWNVGDNLFLRNKLSRFWVTQIAKIVFSLYDLFYRSLKVRMNWEKFWKLFIVNRNKRILELSSCYKLFVFGLKDSIAPYHNFMPAYQYISEPKQMMVTASNHYDLLKDPGWREWIIAKVND